MPSIVSLNSDWGTRHTGPEGHHGDDYPVPTGTPVEAPFNGTVAFAGPHGGFGNLVIIQNQLGSYMLGHLSSIATGANGTAYAVPGEPVTAGDIVGFSGNTGISTGPHLHYEQHGPGPIFLPGLNPPRTNPANLERPCR